MATLEDGLRLKIAGLTESNSCILWTFPLLQNLALEEREKEALVHMEVLFSENKIKKNHPSPEF